MSTTLEQSALGLEGVNTAEGASRERATDSLVLGAMVLLSAALYVGALGSYSDDWAHLRLLHESSDQSPAGLATDLFVGDTVIQQRPLQVAQLAALLLQQQVRITAADLLQSAAIVAPTRLGLPPSAATGPVEVEGALVVWQREEPRQATHLRRGQRDHLAPPFPPGGGLTDASFARARVTSR